MVLARLIGLPNLRSLLAFFINSSIILNLKANYGNIDILNNFYRNIHDKWDALVIFRKPHLDLKVKLSGENRKTHSQLSFVSTENVKFVCE